MLEYACFYITIICTMLRGNNFIHMSKFYKIHDTKLIPDTKVIYILSLQGANSPVGKLMLRTLSDECYI